MLNRVVTKKIIPSFIIFAYYDGQHLAISKHLSLLFESNNTDDNYIMFGVKNAFQFFQNNSYTDPSANIITSRDYVVPMPTNNTKKLLVARFLYCSCGVKIPMG